MQSGAQAHVCACFILMEVMPLQDSCWKLLDAT
jgi:hypothetical protein